jgi:hypothetical protein
MGRKTSHKIGDTNGQLEILNIVPSNKQGQHVKLLCLCHNCNTEKTINGGHFRKLISCGCLQRVSSSWKNVGPKNMPWQLNRGLSAKNSLKYSYIRGAKKRNLEYNLTDEEFDKLIVGECKYCGCSLQNVKKGQGKTSGDFHYTGIDRIDSTKGYFSKNCVSCCWMCNNMKNNYMEEQFWHQIEQIYKHMKERGYTNE